MDKALQRRADVRLYCKAKNVEGAAFEVERIGGPIKNHQK